MEAKRKAISSTLRLLEVGNEKLNLVYVQPYLKKGEYDNKYLSHLGLDL